MGGQTDKQVKEGIEGGRNGWKDMHGQMERQTDELMKIQADK